MSRLATIFWRSPLSWGLLLTCLFYFPVQWGVIDHPLVARYLAGHWVEYIETAFFFVGVSALYLKWREVKRQIGWAGEPLLPAVPHGGQTVEQIPQLTKHLEQKVGDWKDDYLPRRLRDGLQAVTRRGNADKLDEELKYLGDLDAARAQQSYAFVRIIIWAIPILGFLGTVIGITEAIGNLSPQQIEASLPQVTAGLGTAFDTTAVALAFSMVLMFTQYLTDKREQQLLELVDQQAALELSGRFPLQLALDDPLHAVVERLIHAVTPTYDRLLHKQIELWQATIDEAHEHWSQLSQATGAQVRDELSSALTISLEKHALALADRETSHWAGIRDALDRGTEKLVKQQNDLARHSEILLKVADATKHIATVEESLNANLQTLAGSQQLQETLVALSGTLQLLTAKLGALPVETATIELPRKKTRGHAA